MPQGDRGRPPAAPDDPAERSVVMAEIGAPHGVRGWVKLTVFAEDPATLRRYNPFHDPKGRRFKITALKPVGKSLTAQIEGVADRDAAALLRGTRLEVPRSRLPRPEEDEFYHVDLIGLEARLADGTVLGHVRDVADYGAGDLLDLTGGVMLPFTREVVPVIDIEGGFLTVEPPAGLLDEAKPEPGEDGA